jgi:hypothetical protein
MSKIETNTIDTISGTTNLTIGSTNSSTVTFENGAATGHMYPAFYAFLDANQTGVADGATVKVQVNSEVFDTDNCYDNSTNYRFTPNKAGKYFIFGSLRADAGSTNLQAVGIQIRKNGSQTGMVSQYHHFSTNRPDNITINAQCFFDMNGTDDYLEMYIYNDVNTGTTNIIGNSTQKITSFGGYRIGA